MGKAHLGRHEQGRFLEVASVPGLFYHPEWDVTLSCHGDDFLAEGEAQDLDKLDEVMLANFETKVLPRLGDPESGGEVTSGKHLGRTISWSKAGYTWESDDKYSRTLVKELGLEGGNGVDSPSSSETGKGQRNCDQPLDSQDAAEFRKFTGTALYLSLDRPSIQYAVSDIASGMANPTILHMLKIKRLGRYLLKHPREIWEFECQETPKSVCVMSDSDWATCKTTRKP